MFLRVLPASPTLADRFSWFLGVVINEMALEVRRRGMGHALETAMQRRILGLWKRLRSVLARWDAGTLRAARARAVRALTPPPDFGPLHGANPQGEGDSDIGGACADGSEDSCPHPDRAALRTNPPQERERGQVNNGRVVWAPEKLLGRVGWLGRLMPRVERTVFLPLLNDPEMQAIFERAPQVGRILRPWCRVFELEMPEWLKLPKRIRKKKPALPPDPRAARFPDTPPARAAARALARELAGLPVNVDNLSAEARGYYLHPPRDDNCPPPKIGYAGRRRPLPKDYVPPKDWE